MGNELSQAIHDAIARSRCLIVICSPSSRRSAYVRREIDAFAAAHGTERIIAALVGGRPNHEVASADPLQDQAFPESLCRLFEEPLAADFRAHSADTGWQRRTRYREALFSLLASLLGVEKEELVRRQRSRTVRRLIAAVVVALGLTIAFAGVAVQALRAKAVAIQERLKASSRSLSVQARSNIPKERRRQRPAVPPNCLHRRSHLRVGVSSRRRASQAAVLQDHPYLFRAATSAQSGNVGPEGNRELRAVRPPARRLALPRAARTAMRPRRGSGPCSRAAVRSRAS